MKKRNLWVLLMMVLLSCTLVFAGCSSDSEDEKEDTKTEKSDDKDDDSDDEDSDKKDDEDSDKKDNDDDKASELDGTWVGEWDATELFVESMTEGDPTMKEYFDFEDMVIGFTFDFDGDEMTMQVDEASVEDFAEKCVNGMVDAMTVYMEELAEQSSMTLEELLAGAGYDNMEDALKAMGMTGLEDQLIEEMGIDTNKEKGTFEVEDDKILVTYADGHTEEMEFEVDGDELTLTYDQEDMEMLIKCKRK